MGYFTIFFCMCVKLSMLKVVQTPQKPTSKEIIKFAKKVDLQRKC